MRRMGVVKQLEEEKRLAGVGKRHVEAHLVFRHELRQPSEC